jgi:hypothetical protein
MSWHYTALIVRSFILSKVAYAKACGHLRVDAEVTIHQSIGGTETLQPVWYYLRRQHLGRPWQSARQLLDIYSQMELSVRNRRLSFRTATLNGYKLNDTVWTPIRIQSPHTTIATSCWRELQNSWREHLMALVSPSLWTLSVFLHFVGPSLFPNNRNMKTFITERVSHIPADGVAFYMKGTWELSKELELGIVDGLGGLMRNC